MAPPDILNHMSYSQDFPEKLMDMGSLSGIMLGTVPKYKKDSYVHCSGYLNEADIDRSSNDREKGNIISI